jgi:hypothetical protein
MTVMLFMNSDTLLEVFLDPVFQQQGQHNPPAHGCCSQAGQVLSGADPGILKGGGSSGILFKKGSNHLLGAICIGS